MADNDIAQQVAAIEHATRLVNLWARLYKRWLRIARLKRIWAHMGGRLKQLKNGEGARET